MLGIHRSCRLTKEFQCWYSFQCIDLLIDLFVRFLRRAQEYFTYSTTFEQETHGRQHLTTDTSMYVRKASRLTPPQRPPLSPTPIYIVV